MIPLRRSHGIRVMTVGLLSTTLLIAPGLGRAQDDVTERVRALNAQGVIAGKAGELATGIALVRQALALDPSDTLSRTNLSAMLTDWAMARIRAGEIAQAAEALEEAVRLDARNGAALIQRGNLAFIHQHDPSTAARFWKRAHGLVTAAEWHALTERVAQAERDVRLERTFARSATEHFDIQSPRDVPDESLTTLHQLLEAEYARQTERLGPLPARITVLLYEGEDFARVSLGRDWALGLYDGRVRLRASELASAQAPWLIAHELTHAFLHQRFGAWIPLWIHEGYAQVCEGDHLRTEGERRVEARVRDRTHWVPLEWLDRRFTQPSGRDAIEHAYVQARVAVAELIDRFGEGAFAAFLARLADGTTVERAYDELFAPSRWVRANAGNFE